MKKIIVSKFKNYESTSPIDIDLFEWLNDITYKETVLKIRNLTDKTEIKKLKSKLPCITPSGTFLIRNDRVTAKLSVIYATLNDTPLQRHCIVGHSDQLKLMKNNKINYALKA